MTPVSHGNCSLCGQKVMWLRTRNGKMMPMNPDPVEDGRFIIIMDEIGDPTPIKFANAIDVKDREFHERYECHIETCEGRNRDRRATE